MCLLLLARGWNIETRDKIKNLKQENRKQTLSNKSNNLTMKLLILKDRTKSQEPRIEYRG